MPRSQSILERIQSRSGSASTSSGVQISPVAFRPINTAPLGSPPLIFSAISWRPRGVFSLPSNSPGPYADVETEYCATTQPSSRSSRRCALSRTRTSFMSAFYAGEFVVERGFGKHARTNASIFHIVVKVRVSEVRFAEAIPLHYRSRLLGLYGCRPEFLGNLFAITHS